MRYYYKNKNNNSMLNFDLELTLENYPDWTQEQINEYEESTEEEFNRLQTKLNPEPVAPTAEELEIQNAQNRIWELKGYLSSTDYQAIKYAEGLINEEEYLPMKQQRQAWRDEINQLQEQYNLQ